MSAKATNGVGNPIACPDFRHAVIQLVASASASAVVKIQGSCSELAPNFANAQTATNHWDYIAVYDLNDPTSIIKGDTGITFSAVSVADSCRNLLVNTDLLKWINVEISGLTGNITAKLLLADNQ